MMTSLKRRIATGLLVTLDTFLAVTAVGGGIGLLTGAIAPGTDLLQGSPFSSYLVPGMALLILVGGSAILAIALMLRFRQLGELASAVAGMMIMGFELVEIVVIGSEAGIARNLQLFYISLGLLISILGAGMWMSDQKVQMRSTRYTG
jgi:hypothetical protein